MALVSRLSVEAAGSLLLMALAALVVLLSGLAIVAILPVALVIVAMAYSEVGPASGIAGWFFLLWFPAAFAAATYNVVSGLGVMDRPGLGGTARLLGVTILIFFTFPPFWYPEA